MRTKERPAPGKTTLMVAMEFGYMESMVAMELGGVVEGGLKLDASRW
jgi:hypothetical protein